MLKIQKGNPGKTQNRNKETANSKRYNIKNSQGLN